VPADLNAPPPDAKKTAGGVAVAILEKGHGEAPSAERRMKLHFTGWTTDGRLIESTRLAGQPALYSLSEVIPGWREALQQMVVGDRARVWIPAALAYGDHPRRRGLPAGNLIYEFELLAIE
jgi:peptidylprolyl isomerase